MGTGTRIANTIIRGAIKANKEAVRERARREREYIRLEKQSEKNRIREEKEELKFQKQLEKEKLAENKEKLKQDLEDEKIVFEKRQKERRDIRMNYINKI